MTTSDQNLVPQSTECILRIHQAVYPQPAVLKAAYHFIDRCYIHVDMDEKDYILTIKGKENFDISSITNELTNELLAQTVRYSVYQQTHTIREILMARAMASTLTDTETPNQIDENEDNTYDLIQILMDWFDSNEQH